MKKLVAESLQLFEEEAKKTSKSKNDDIKEKIELLKKELEEAKKPGSLKGSKIQKDAKIKELEEKIAKFKAKL